MEKNGFYIGESSKTKSPPPSHSCDSTLCNQASDCINSMKDSASYRQTLDYVNFIKERGLYEEFLPILRHCIKSATDLPTLRLQFMDLSAGKPGLIADFDKFCAESDQRAEEDMKIKIFEKRVLALIDKAEKLVSENEFVNLMRVLYNYNTRAVSGDDTLAAVSQILGRDRNPDLVEEFIHFFNFPEEFLSEDEKGEKRVNVDFEKQRDEVLCSGGEVYELEMLMGRIRFTFEKVKELISEIEKMKMKAEEINLRIEDFVSKNCVLKMMYKDRLTEMVEVVKENPVEGLSAMLKRLQQKEHECAERRQLKLRKTFM